MSTQDTKVLLINDIAGYGKVALSAMLPILSYKGFNLYNLPTAIVSNTLNYEKFRILMLFQQVLFLQKNKWKLYRNSVRSNLKKEFLFLTIL